METVDPPLTVRGPSNAALFVLFVLGAALYASGIATGYQLNERPTYLVEIDAVETRSGNRYGVTPDATVRETYEVGRLVRSRYPSVYKLARKELTP